MPISMRSPTTDVGDITFLPENLQTAEKCCIFALEFFDSWFIRGRIDSNDTFFKESSRVPRTPARE
jgi:hypothetical protein